MKRIATLAVAVAAAGTLFSGAAHAATASEELPNVSVSGTAIGTFQPGTTGTYVIDVEKSGGPLYSQLFKLDAYVNKGQVVTGVEHVTNNCEYAFFAATCDILGLQQKPKQQVKVHVKVLSSATGPMTLDVSGITSVTEQTLDDNRVIINGS
ncbi:hypothetical protein [Nonomuraea longicatena]|uniref:Secreted protein n=1 Tax=Nonomuraea longicatena TaxID=83682 RepID=A0ABN1RBR2_9ACTN